MSPLQPISVFEHTVLNLKDNPALLKALQGYYGQGMPYYSLVHNGVKFNSHVGVLQVGKQVIEVLPKAEREDGDKQKWRGMLIDMLRAVRLLKASPTGNAALRIKPNHLLDLYFELFVDEVEKLVQKGLIKRYRKTEGNLTALKGSIHFARHLQLNHTHQERFYVRHGTYDQQHLLHQLLYKTLRLLFRINTNMQLNSRIGSLLLHFPEQEGIKVTEATFEKIGYNRKNEDYRQAIDIAKMILLKFHPDINRGGQDVLALMFDMNRLWEEFLYSSLRKDERIGHLVSKQTSRYFWKPDEGYRTRMRPDIWINVGKGEHIVLDTKWKNLNGYNPSVEDLRQMYVYHDYFEAKKVALVYPGNPQNNSHGRYYLPMRDELSERGCSVICIEPSADIRTWEKEICAQVTEWIRK